MPTSMSTTQIYGNFQNKKSSKIVLIAKKIFDQEIDEIIST
jgi:hypothetical protein